MTAGRIVRGTIRGGVVVLEENVSLLDGEAVDIVLPVFGSSSERSAETDIWKQARRESEVLRAKWDRQPKDANGWPQSFLEDTYGSLADDSIERLPQGELETRKEIE